MAGSEPTTRTGPFRVRTIYGEPYEVLGRRLTPVARVVSWGKASGTVGTHRLSGWAGGGSRITPLAFLEETEQGQRRIAVADPTAAALRVLFALAVAITILSAAVRQVARRLRRS